MMHLLRTMDLIDTHNFAAGQSIRRSLILAGEVKSWYQSIHPFHINWEELLKFRAQFPKIGNIREQLFYAWRSFHYDGNAETIDANVGRI